METPVPYFTVQDASGIYQAATWAEVETLAAADEASCRVFGQGFLVATKPEGGVLSPVRGFE
jgi:hypothetical protein